MAKMKRRNPIRTTGALLINPRRRRKARRNAAPGVRPVNVSRYTRSGKHGHSVSAYSRYKPGTAPARRRKTASRRRRNPLRLVNPHRRHRARKVSHRRRVSVKRRHNPKRRHHAKRRVARVQFRANPRRHGKRRVARHRKHTMRRNPRRAARRNPAMFKGVSSKLSKIPLIGPILASTAGFFGPGVFGALSVEPTLAVSQVVARYAPNTPTSLLYPLTGLVLGAATDVYFGRWLGLKPETRRNLAVAMSAAGGGVGYYLWRTGRATTAGAEMGTLLLSGYGSPIAGAIMGDLGDLYVQAPEYGALLMQQPQAMAGVDSFGGYGPMSVSPLSAMSPGATL